MGTPDAPTPPRDGSRSWRVLGVTSLVVAAVAVAIAVWAVSSRDGGVDVALTPPATPTLPTTISPTPSLPIPTAPDATRTPTTTVTPTATSTTPAASPTATAGEPTPTPDGSPPARLVAITEDGRLVVVDTATGEEVRELDALADPREPPQDEGPAPNALTEIALAPDGRTAVYSDCCEPATGNTYVTSIDGGTPERRWDGFDPAVSPDGTRVFLLNAIGWAVFPIDGRQPDRFQEVEDLPPLAHPTWSPDGARVAVEVRQDDGPSELQLWDVASGTVAPVAASGSPTRPEWRPDGIVVVDQCCGFDPTTYEPGEGQVIDPASGAVLETFPVGGPVLDLDYDPTRTWLLVTLADGRLVLLGGGEERTITDGVRAASW